MLGITENLFSVAEIVRQKSNQALCIQVSYEILSNVNLLSDTIIGNLFLRRITCFSAFDRSWWYMLGQSVTWNRRGKKNAVYLEVVTSLCQLK